MTLGPAAHIPADQGLLFHLIKARRPALAARIVERGVIDTMVIGLGGQGTRHAGLMRDYGTRVTCGVAPGKGGTFLHETIPVYTSAAAAVAAHPDIAVASIWRHHTTARESTIEAIEAGIPIVVLITEHIPQRDVRDILVAARKHGTLLIGGNTPGLIFPPEGIKTGMLPDVFHAAEPEPGQLGAQGVTILSRSGAILYHMSDALASAGIAQNAVIGVGGDGVIGAPFVTLVKEVMAFPGTDLVVIAGEIGGAQEERLATDMKAHPDRYPKPMVALIAGRCAPEGKTMGHAGAIVAPGAETGTYAAKRQALEAAGVTVVNHQLDLIKAVQDHLGNKVYFETDRYYARMKTIWEAPPKQPTWSTLITEVRPNDLRIAGYPLQDLVIRKSLLAVTHLLIEHQLPTADQLTALEAAAMAAVTRPAPARTRQREEEDISESLARALLDDDLLYAYSSESKDRQVMIAAFGLGRMVRYLAVILDNEAALDAAQGFPAAIVAALAGAGQNPACTRLLQAMVVACVDHGVTPPSAQATILVATVRPTYETAVAHGIGAITDVHGGAGAKAAAFFARATAADGELETALRSAVEEQVKARRRIEGLGHRVHTDDPRRAVLWQMSDEAGISGRNVEASKLITGIFKEVKGMDLPINVDGVIGAIVADLGLEPRLAKAIFILGRVAGLSAHYFEEIATQRPMRRVDFGQARYRGEAERDLT